MLPMRLCIRTLKITLMYFNSFEIVKKEEEKLLLAGLLFLLHKCTRSTTDSIDP
jgi:hypothetical protein